MYEGVYEEVLLYTTYTCNIFGEMNRSSVVYL